METSFRLWKCLELYILLEVSLTSDAEFYLAFVVQG